MTPAVKVVTSSRAADAGVLLTMRARWWQRRPVWKVATCEPVPLGTHANPLARFRLTLHQVPDANLAVYGWRRRWFGTRLQHGAVYRCVETFQ